MKSEIISIKPHHFVDIITSFGAGKRIFEPHPFQHAVHIVSKIILENPNSELKIKLDIDDICKPCRYNINNSCIDRIDISFRPKAPSSKSAWNLLIDQRWCKKLNIIEGDRLTAAELCKKIRSSINDIFDIYPEMPLEQTEKRKANLLIGLDFYEGHCIL